MRIGIAVGNLRWSVWCSHERPPDALAHANAKAHVAPCCRLPCMHIVSPKAVYGIGFHHQLIVLLAYHQVAFSCDGSAPTLSMVPLSPARLLACAPPHAELCCWACCAGEVTLTGRVLPIGGLKEKLLAAKRSDVTTVLFPEGNRKDWDELSGACTPSCSASMLGTSGPSR